MIDLSPVTLPDFGIDDRLPNISVAEYASRLDATVERMRAADLDALVVYADREHSANLAFLTGFDPRFEEALLLMDAEGRRLLLVGNECMGYLPDIDLGLHVERFQPLSLMGQDRGASRPLRGIVSDFGIGHGARVGCAGWKYFDDHLVGDPQHAFEIPAYVIDLLRDMTGDTRRVRNVGAMFMNPTDGLRAVNSVDQIARFEYAAIRTSESVKALVFGLQENIPERDLESCYRPGGLPLSCHAMVSFGDKARRGLSSPSSRRATLGEPFTAAFGIEGALTCRAGMVARDRDDVPDDRRAFFEAFAHHYVEIVATWYRHVRVGAIAGDVVASVEARRDDRLMRFAVNPGHLIHLDEWMHSPFVPGGRSVLQSGMALQMDIIPVSRGPFVAMNAEDGVVLADEALRGALAAAYPDAWARIEHRRAFMADVVGIELDPSVLPLSNIPAWIPPFGLDPGRALVADRTPAPGGR